MKSRSVKKTLPKLTKLMVAFFLVLILPVNLYLQNYLQHRSQRENATEMFGQLEHLMKVNKLNLQIAEKDFKDKSMHSVKMAAYFIEHKPEVLEDEVELQKLKRSLDVDEIYFYTPDGIMFAGTNPKYIGMSLETSEKMKFFRPMLEDRGKCFCQDIVLNDINNIDMQYAAIWTEDQSCIVQIGMQSWRLMKDMRDKGIQSVIKSMPFELSGYLHIVDKETHRVLASTAHNLVGKDMSTEKEINKASSELKEFHENYQGTRYCVYTKSFDDYILVRSYESANIIKERWTSTVLVFAYIILVTIGIVGIIRWFLHRKIIGNLWMIIGELKK